MAKRRKNTKGSKKALPKVNQVIPDRKIPLWFRIGCGLFALLFVAISWFWYL